ncbi:SNARE associated Golgi protein, partial [Cynara cardunculus var. scolymus]
MTYSQLKIPTPTEDCKGDYEILIERDRLGGGGGGALPSSSGNYSGGGGIWYFYMQHEYLTLESQELIPILNWETATFTKPMLAVLLFASMALFPTILLPSTPSMWVTGMTFGYGEGDWFNQFKAVVLLRVSPFPYIMYNYCAVATGVKFGPYLLGTLVGMVPEIFIAMGIVIGTLADASNDERSFSAPQIICTVVGFVLTVVTTMGVTVYAKRRLIKKNLLVSEEKIRRHHVTVVDVVLDCALIEATWFSHFTMEEFTAEVPQSEI